MYLIGLIQDIKVQIHVLSLYDVMDNTMAYYYIRSWVVIQDQYVEVIREQLIVLYRSTTWWLYRARIW